MLIVKNIIDVPCYEGDAEKYYKDEGAVLTGQKLLERYPFEKINGGVFMTMKEYSEKVNGYCTPTDERFCVRFEQCFITASKEEWRALKQTVKAALTLLSDPSARALITNAFDEFERHPTTLNQQHDTFKESEKR